MYKHLKSKYLQYPTHHVKKKEDIRKYICSFVQKKYKKDKLDTKKNGYLQGVSGKGVERREELEMRQ